MPEARCVCYVEREAFCCAHLVDKMQQGWLDEAPVWTDIRTFDGRPWRGKVVGLVGGYPCQPFSVAGKRAGEADPRHLWPEIKRLVCEIRPRWCFFENVAGHLRLGFDRVLCDLAKIGYDAVWTTLAAGDVGATHQRKRLFILAFTCAERPSREQADETRPRNNFGKPGGTKLADACGIRQKRPSKIGKLEGKQRLAIGGQGIFPPGPGELEKWAEILKRQPELAPAVADTKPKRHKKGMQPETVGADSADGNETQPAVCGMADGLASRVERLRALGNGVVPIQAAVAFRMLADFARRGGLVIDKK